MNPKIAKLIQQYQDHHTEEAMVTLWEDFQPLVINCMRKFYVTTPQREDTRQDIFIQMLECANAYDPKQGVPFESYFKIRLHYWFLNRIRKKTELLVMDHGWESGCIMTDLIESTMGNASEITETNDTHKTVEDALQGLTQKQQQVIRLFYWEETPLTQIAVEMGCSYKVACKHKAAGIMGMRRAWIKQT